MIRVDGLRKTYGDFDAVVGSSFSVDSGEVFGIVGPNGAGKTTTLKMLSGLIEPTEGTATVVGYDAADPEMRQSLGFLPEESPLYEDMTARSYLRFFADLYEVPREEAIDRAESTLDRLELQYRDRRLGDMSKGMKRKVAIARSLVNDPDVVIYDEPASGLDPLTTNTVLEFTRELKDDGKTVVFSAHNLYHVESVCDRIVIMNEGRIIARGSIADIREAYGSREYQIRTDVAVDGAEQIDESADTDRAVYLVCVSDLDGVDRTRELISEAGGTMLDLKTDEPSLESIFLELTGRPMTANRTSGANAGGLE
ncbi:MAG: ATP-binding cassette domain-containing protein [Halobacteriota archaeon]